MPNPAAAAAGVPVCLKTCLCACMEDLGALRAAGHAGVRVRAGAHGEMNEHSFYCLNAMGAAATDSKQAALQCV